MIGVNANKRENKEIKFSENCWLPLLILERVGKIVTKIKLQKLIFLIQNEVKIEKGYNFRRHYYGPYSHALAADMEILSQNELVDKEGYIGARSNYFIYRSTNTGNELFSSMESEIEDSLIEKVDSCIDKYKDCDHNSITEFVYKKYLPEESEYRERIADIDYNLYLLELLWREHYTPECTLYIDAMAIVEYLKLLFNRLEQNNRIDDVVRGVILVSSEDLVQNLIEITEEHQDENEIIDNSLIELFDFLCYYSAKNEILESPEDLDFDELIDEENECQEAHYNEPDTGSIY